MPKDKEIASNPAAELLSEAIDVLGNRSITHGARRKNMDHIAALWSAYLGVPILAVDVTQMMVLLKASRIKCGGVHKEHPKDQAGYAALTWEVSQPFGVNE